MLSDPPVLTHAPLSSVARGVVLELLEESYAPLLGTLPLETRSALLRDWQAYDRAIAEEPLTVGAAGFASLSDGHPAGFASWDPRGRPEVVEIGHNCVAPDFRGRGLGTLQIRECLSRFAAAGFRRVRVRTGEHAFFVPALRMYEKCGFHVIATEPARLLPGHTTLLLEKSLRSRRASARTAPR